MSNDTSSYTVQLVNARAKLKKAQSMAEKEAALKEVAELQSRVFKTGTGPGSRHAPPR